MPNQPDFPSLCNAMKQKQTRRQRFLAEMDAVMPRCHPRTPIAPQYPKAGPKVGRPPMPTETTHQTISAVLQGAGENRIAGYRPAFNFPLTLPDTPELCLCIPPERPLESSRRRAVRAGIGTLPEPRVGNADINTGGARLPLA